MSLFLCLQGALEECWALGVQLARAGFILSITLQPPNTSLTTQISIKERMNLQFQRWQQRVNEAKVKELSIQTSDLTQFDPFLKSTKTVQYIVSFVEEYVSLLRILLKCDSWQSCIQQKVYQSLNTLPQLILKEGPHQSILKSILASLFLISSWPMDVLRVGGLANFRITPEVLRKAIIVSYARIGNETRIAFLPEEELESTAPKEHQPQRDSIDCNTLLIQLVDTTKLLPLPEVSIKTC
jgi:hypothetical protein